MTTANSRFMEAASLMDAFARRPRRYLWTDAFAVYNYLELGRVTGDSRWETRSLDLVDRVHRVLGKYRPDDRTRHGWISGLPDAEAEAHPTAGGLRIGKPLPERLATEPYDRDLEWDRDGQYFHYLTQWMHALDRVARATGQPVFHGWARELAAVAHGAFTDGPTWGRRMFWKLSIDRSHPLVRSMGQHDPLDGLVTYVGLEATAKALRFAPTPSLEPAIADFARMLEQSDFTTTNPLGLGGLLSDAARLARAGGHEALVSTLLDAALHGLRHFEDAPNLREPADRRLAFRELGLAIGLAALPRLDARQTAELMEFAPLGDEITSFWRQATHRRSPTWTDHQDINEVMFAASCLAGR